MKHKTTKTLVALGILLLASLTGCDRPTEDTSAPTAKPFMHTVPQPAADTLPALTDIPCRAEVTVHVAEGDALHMKTEGLSLRAAGGSVTHSGDYSVTRLYAAELPALPQGMENLTAAAAGYRLLPSGDHFSPAAELRVAYDPGRLPQGYTPDDIYTSYYDSSAMAWVRLERIAVDTANREIVSLTTHFTDFVNEVLKAPEMPETQAFVPTMMSDLEAVNPLEGLPLFQPPTANQEGTANLNYPIWIPQGRGGMQPSLALTYSSGGGNGWLGVGWDLSVPSVTLDTRWGVPRYNSVKETEIYMFCGEQLVNKDANGAMLPLPHRTNRQLNRMTGDIRFYARTSDAHDSIVRHGDTPSDYWWEVTDRSGTTHYYGHYPTEGMDAANPSTLTDDNGNIARWMLCESRDVYDNWVRYFYKVETTPGTNWGRQIYLDSIVYTGNRNEDGVYNVAFTLKDRNSSDIPTSCNLGFKEETAKQLCMVTVRTRDSILTAYHFETECSYWSNFKTRLAAINKIDNISGVINFWSSLKDVCTNGIDGIQAGITRQTFDYFDAPATDTLFGDPHTSSHSNDNIKGFVLTPQYRIDSVNRATALGMSHSSSWSVGGTLGAGLGPEVCLTSISVGSNYHQGKNTSESLMTLVDLDGDGVADKVFVQNGKMYWRKQTLSPNGDFVAGDTHYVRGASHFLVEGSTNHTVGIQASVPSIASGSGAWSESTSTTPTYFADVDGDGLMDIVDNGMVLFNHLDDGLPTFTEYQSHSAPGNGQDLSDPPHTTSSPCGGIIFDGAVDDSVGCRIVWALADSSQILHREDIAEWRQTFYNGLFYIRTEARECIGGYRIYYYRGTIDCSQRDLAMDGVPATEAVRVWVSPDDGTATVRSWVKLIEDESDKRAMSRHTDGITYTIQHSRNITPMGDTLHSLKDTLLMSRHICAECYRYDAFDNLNHNLYDSTLSNIEVKKGDLLFFRLQSGDDKQFDNAETHIKITFDGMDYLSDEGFLLTEDKYFQAPYDGEYSIDGTYNNSEGDVAIDIEQPDGAYHYGSGALDWVGNIEKDSVIRISFNTSNPDAYWSGVDMRARIRFWNEDLPDTITVWTPGDKNVVHPSGSIWGDAKYQRLFGTLYNGWGQFAYHPAGSEGDSPLIRPGSLVPLAHALPCQAGDTNSLRGKINNPIPDDGFNQPSIDAFTETFGSQYNIMSSSSRWVPMTADAQHSRWVAFGAQSSIGLDTMSNSIQDGWYSSVRSILSDSSVCLAQDADYDDAVPVQTGDTPVKAVRKVNRSRSQSYTLGIAQFSGAYSNGRSSVEMDYMDLNGDRYPDIVGSCFVQYRSQWGGLGEKTTLPVNIADVTTSVTNSAGMGFGASPVQHERVISGSPAVAKFSLSGDGSLSGDFNIGWDHATGSWTDINGDGLPDYVTQGGGVRLNIGYDFLDKEDWDFDGVHSGQSASASVSFGLSGAFNKFNVAQGSIELGAGLSRSANRTGRTFMDINGDGLPDMVWRKVADIDIDDWDDLLHPVDSVHVKFNLGGGRWSRQYDMNINNFNWSENYNESLNRGATIGVTFFGAFKATCGINGTLYSSSVSRDRMQLVDVNGDGLPDLVTSDREGEMTVRYHRGGRTNLLKGVTNFTGSRIRLDYALSAPDRNQPSRSWQLVLVTTKDPLNPNGADTTVTRIAYSNPHYDRLERSSYGYGTVIVDQVNPADNTVYRSIRRDFHNENILVKGRPKRELTSDGQGNRYVEKEYQYGYAAYDGGTVDTCSGNAYSLRDRIVTRHFEGTADPKLTTAEAFEYDRYHNVTKYVDEGDTAYSDDGLYVDFTYLSGQAHNLIGLRDSYKVYATGTSGNDWMRSTSLEYWDKGKLKKQIMHNSPATSEFEFWYDSYGNLAKARKPQNDSLQRMEYQYTYDAYTHTYPVKIRDSQGDSVMTSYLLHFGRPTSVVDPTGSTMRYTYDRAGRLLSVTSPLNSSTMPSLVNEYYPINYYNVNMPLTYGFATHPYAVTAHYDDQGALITHTVVITDGFGRVIQTKKGITSGSQQKMQVSGREFTDAFGRATGRHDVFCENLSASPGNFNPHISRLVDTILYDVLDRDIEVRQPSMNYTTMKQYDVLNDASSHRRFTVSVKDPNNHTTVQFSDYDGRQVQVTDALGGITRMTYDALGQLLFSTDPENFTTAYTYDKLGHLTKRVHPDAGTTQYSYDAAGNMTHESNPLGDIFYDYTYQRLARKRYSDIVENNVTYTYGTGGTSQGRLVRIEDGTGIRELEYDALGNVTGEVRTIALPGIGNVYTFATGYRYDSWGRMMTMTYPDGEVVTYTYGFGGDLYSMYGDKGSDHYDYVTSIRYNNFGQRSQINYGNGTYATYGYDALHRLTSLVSMSSSGAMQQLRYVLDGVGNITNIQNGASSIGILGGTYVNNYQYDALYRLVGSHGENANYNIGMRYSTSGRLMHKITLSNATYPVNIDAYFGYCSHNHPHAPKRIYEINEQMLTELQWDDAGNLCQVNTAKDLTYDDTRFLFWTEDSRLHTVVDYQWHSYYAYDHSGVRTLKLSGPNNVIDINADIMLTTGLLKKVTLYPSPFLVVDEHGYTKHYYVGGDRLCARIGGGGIPTISHNHALSNKANGLFEDCLHWTTDRKLTIDEPECIHGLDWDGDIFHEPIKDAPIKLNAEPILELTSFDHTMDYYSCHSEPENKVYFYHSDHLGSANWISDSSGMPVQHLQYLPFGERYINQRTTGYDERFTFTGKEKDPETGYSYFGARYLDHELMTTWLSVDPMSDKYPSISPYAYCAWNPMKLVDPDGMEFDPTTEEKYIKPYENEVKERMSRINALRGTEEWKPEYENQYCEYQNILTEIDGLRNDEHNVYSIHTGVKMEKETTVGELRYSGVNSSGQRKISINLATKLKDVFLFMGTMAHELKHAYQYYNKQLGFVLSNGIQISSSDSQELECEAHIRDDMFSGCHNVTNRQSLKLNFELNPLNYKFTKGTSYPDYPISTNVIEFRSCYGSNFIYNDF